jgi:hypothetical protein
MKKETSDFKWKLEEIRKAIKGVIAVAQLGFLVPGESNHCSCHQWKI